ncbi:MAG TPA: AAA family ATPase [Pseudonocardiaceae bacterium]|jgi:DNA-binding CsgD family transcriptional regulator|nr:AAA family ATPase [Pseudonocardiaceae bacterium]
MRTRSPRLIGRHDELDVVEQSLRDARKGSGRPVFVVGEAGIGKSRLAAEAVSRAFTADMVVLRGRGSTVGPMVPFRPLTEALLSLFRSRDLPTDHILDPYRPVLGRLVPQWARPDTPSGGESLVVLAEALLRLLNVVGSGRGCLVVLEDLHDADVETLAVVEYLADHLDSEPTVLLATCRTEPSQALDIADGVERGGRGETIELARLDYADMCRLAASCLDVEPDELPESVLRKVWESSVGNPFIVEELLQGMVGGGQLVLGARGWREVESVRAEIPPTLVRVISQRVDRLGPQARELLCAAAVLGIRFRLSMVQKIIGVDDHVLVSELQASVSGQLVSSDERGPDWYSFQHPLIADALLSRLTPVERVVYSRRAAEAIESMHPDLPGEWCQVVATLRLAAGEPVVAASRFAEAGRRALAGSAAGSAIQLLDKAEALLVKHGDEAARAEVLETLLYALAEAGEFERAFALADTLDTGSAGLAIERRVAVRVRLAWVAQIAGRYEDCAAQVAEARMALGPNPSEELRAPVDAISAHLALDTPGSNRMREAESLARAAIGPAERVPMPVIACQAWYAIGVIVRARDLAESNNALGRAQSIAEEHRLPIWRLYGLSGQATNAWLAEADAKPLNSARTEALRVGAITVALNLDSVLALHAVLRGDFAIAPDLINEGLATVRRLQLPSLERYLLMTRAVLAAHQAHREDMESTCAEFLDRGGAMSRELPLSLGLARTFCALLEENVELAESELAQVRASEAANPVPFYLAGSNGLRLLLDVLGGRVGWREFRDVSSSSTSKMRWNRHFVQLAHAVLLGRAGRTAKAEATMAQAQESAAPYAMARHLGLRLVAEPANADHWGDPVIWLRAAAEYFRQANVSAVTSACRGLLRQYGEHVPQRRTGAGRIPADLRALGVTVREFEVLELLVQRMTNKTIASRLHLSPRTVEKHVASLLLKTDQPNRSALVDHWPAHS